MDISDNAGDFLATCGDWLMDDEVANNGILSIVNAIGAGKSAFGKDAWFGTLRKGEDVDGCALIVQPDGLMLSSLPLDGLPTLCEIIAEAGAPFTRISGPVISTVGFAEGWSAYADCEWSVSHQWRSYMATEVVMPGKPAKGTLRFATDDEHDIVEEWAKYYEEEKPAPVSVVKFLLYKLAEGELYVWDDDGPKTLVAVSGFTENCARVSAVFTPRKFRGNGYASVAVGQVTQKLLESGLTCASLLVDKNDLAVMRIYERLGYKKRGSQVNILLS